MSATSLDQAMLQALQMVATEDEINELVILFDGMSKGHIETWYIKFIYEIIGRLAVLALTTTPRIRIESATDTPPR